MNMVNILLQHKSMNLHCKANLTNECYEPNVWNLLMAIDQWLWWQRQWIQPKRKLRIGKPLSHKISILCWVQWRLTSKWQWYGTEFETSILLKTFEGRLVKTLEELAHCSSLVWILLASKYCCSIVFFCIRKMLEEKQYCFLYF